jgi:hypothetical protein
MQEKAPTAARSRNVLTARVNTAVRLSRDTVDWRKLTVWVAVIAVPWTVLVFLFSALV